MMPILWAEAGARHATLGTGFDGIPWIRWFLALGVLFGLLPGVVAYLVWAERKVAGRFQDRIGPNRVGPFGLLQSIADAIKLITKEVLVPEGGDFWVHMLAPVLLLIASFMVLAVIPIGAGVAAVNPPLGLLFAIALTSLSPLGVFLAGWSSRNKFALLGAMRAVAQLVSYELPQVLATIPIVLWTGSLSLVAIFDRQLDLGWFLFSPPGLLSFAIFMIASVAELNRAPFDLPEAESEIIAGFHTEYSGMRWSLFFLAEYLGILGASSLATVMFLGGGTLPFLGDFPMNLFGFGTWYGALFTNLFYMTVFTIKIVGFVFVFFWVRATLPRMRVDRLMDFAWKVLVPLAILNILIAAIWYELTIRPASPRWVLGWLVTLPLAAGSVAGLFALNRAPARSREGMVVTP
ncbi:NADH-quinone oxidoreductase subunit NuoH [Tundrisphaera sp. TA3]|uniref:NADH-quinone oxidoreductase subunit NuoH n=1 Tax=Tundrisphaera sp. TA3 TaxID=3435775 RepID=UPI003EBE565C